jgi:hypothetical protein
MCRIYVISYDNLGFLSVKRPDSPCSKLLRGCAWTSDLVLGDRIFDFASAFYILFLNKREKAHNQGIRIHLYNKSRLTKNLMYYIILKQKFNSRPC